VLATRAAARIPVVLGVNDTWTVTVCPAVSETGSGGWVLPAANSPWASIAVTCTARWAVKVTGRVAV
jgi:hypothetical protein